MKSLVWLRSDLRLNDNPALKEACTKSLEVQAIYIYSAQQLSRHNESNVKIDFLIQNLNHIAKNLNQLNIPLTII
jgi:deoxyribodipyrimidine photo-lyase